jgi:hypothetical protein
MSRTWNITPKPIAMLTKNAVRFSLDQFCSVSHHAITANIDSNAISIGHPYQTVDMI